MAYVPDQFCRVRREVSPTAQAVYLLCCEFANQKSGHCWADLKRIEHELDLRSDHARKYLNELVEKGWLILRDGALWMGKHWQTRAQRSGKSEPLNVAPPLSPNLGESSPNLGNAINRNRYYYQLNNQLTTSTTSARAREDENQVVVEVVEDAPSKPKSKHSLELLLRWAWAQRDSGVRHPQRLAEARCADGKSDEVVDLWKRTQPDLAEIREPSACQTGVCPLCRDSRGWVIEDGGAKPCPGLARRVPDVGQSTGQEQLRAAGGEP